MKSYEGMLVDYEFPEDVEWSIFKGIVGKAVKEVKDKVAEKYPNVELGDTLFSIAGFTFQATDEDVKSLKEEGWLLIEDDGIMEAIAGEEESNDNS